MVPLLMAALLGPCGSTLRGEDARPVVDDRSMPAAKPAATTLPTLWIVGDSTVNSPAPKRGWGQDLGNFFDPSRINVVNRAIGGRSSRTYFTEGRWESVLNSLKPGDWVIVQFGHNDGGRPDASSKFRGSVQGIGDNTEDVTLANGTVETVHSFGWYLKSYARSAQAKGARVILCSPVPHKKFDASGKFVHDWNTWREWISNCAKETGACFVDLSEIIGQGYDHLDRATVEGFFDDARTHTNAAGALFNAKALVSGLRALPSAPLDRFLSDEGKIIPPSKGID